jgi:hypothetical protein
MRLNACMSGGEQVIEKTIERPEKNTFVVTKSWG